MVGAMAVLTLWPSLTQIEKAGAVLLPSNTLPQDADVPGDVKAFGGVLLALLGGGKQGLRCGPQALFCAEALYLSKDDGDDEPENEDSYTEPDLLGHVHPPLARVFHFTSMVFTPAPSSPPAISPAWAAVS